jgi:hypothetical protein
LKKIEPMPLTPDQIEHYGWSAVRKCYRDYAAIQQGRPQLQPRCLMCGRLVDWGDRYWGSSTDRKRGRVVHDDCFERLYGNPEDRRRNELHSRRTQAVNDASFDLGQLRQRRFGNLESALVRLRRELRVIDQHIAELEAIQRESRKA